MGITPAALKIICNMQQNSLFAAKPLKIIELGSQEVHCNNVELIDNLYYSFGVSPERRNTIFFGDMGRKLFECLGFEYESIDMDGAAKSKPWNINNVTCPESLVGQFVLTTNHGTTEHLIGQDNAFNLMHDLTSIGGYMMHTLPCTGQVNHGFFSYSPIFFFTLAKANDYVIKHFFLTNFEEFKHYEPNDEPPPFSYIITVLQKTNNKPYNSPMQVWDIQHACYIDKL